MTNHDALTNQKALVTAFCATLEDQPVQFFETHISSVVVAGAFAYKFKKPVHYDFVDFSTLERRRFYCEEEVRLNGRLAPDIYLGVAALTGHPERPAIDGPGEVLDYVVKMRAFPQQALWSHRIPARLLMPEEADLLAQRIAAFHETASIAPTSSPWSTAPALQTIADDTLAQIAALIGADEDRWRLAQLQGWESAQRTRLAGVLGARKAAGAIRECHGDLHSGNILTMDGTVEAFDCIEFNDSLRWIDVMNDAAFTSMDLRFLQRPDLAARFLNSYLMATGDYSGLGVLRYYEVHRALVRCKVALLRAAQPGAAPEDTAASQRQGLAYLAFAHTHTRRRQVAILIMHGFSGSGKSTVARQLVETLDAIQLRSDLERKRQHGLSATARAAPEAGLYSSVVTCDTYKRLYTLAMQVTEEGWTVIVDATFLKEEMRRQFRQLALQLGMPFLILDVQADVLPMRTRITRREQAGQDASDAGLAVLAQQIADHDPLSSEEGMLTIAINSEIGAAADVVCEIKERLRAQAATPGAH